VTDGHPPDRSLADRLHSVAIHVLRHARMADTTAGMSAARLSALSVLVFGGPRTVTELADAEQVAAPTMTRLLHGLERDGYVRRRRSDADGRVVRVNVTPKGRRALEAGRRKRVYRLEEVIAALSGPDGAAVDAALTALEAALASVRSQQA
jgi:DNA-binding MarR family transcriptional regulator